MSRYRKIEVSIHNDDRFPYLDNESQLVWFHLYTYPQSTGLGIYMASIEGLWANKNKNGETSLERYRKRFENLVQLGFIEYDSYNQVVYFPKFFNRSSNKPENPNVLRGMLKCWDDIPNHSPLKLKLYNKLIEHSKRWGKGFENVTANLRETLPPSCPKQEQEQEQEQEQDIKRKNIKKKRFAKPTIDDIKNYILEKQLTIDPDYFLDHYESNGWVTGKDKPMRDWKATLRNWQRREQKNGSKPKTSARTLRTSYASDLDDIARADIEKNGLADTLDH